MKNAYLYWMFFVAIVILTIDNVNAQCSTPFDGVNYSSSRVDICAGTYYFNDSDNNGAIIINGSNTYINGSNAIFIDLNAGTSQCISASASHTNITIANLRCQNFSRGFSGTAVKNFLLENISLINITTYGVINGGLGSYSEVNMTIHNLTYDGIVKPSGGLFYLDRNKNVIIRNGRFSVNNTNTNPFIYVVSSTSGYSINLQINNNSAYGTNFWSSQQNITNLNITNNRIFTTLNDSTYPYVLYSGVPINNFLFSNNQLYNSSLQIDIKNIVNLNVSNNNFYNHNNSKDSYRSFVLLIKENVTNCIIENNVFNISDTHIAIQGANSTCLIESNVFDNGLTNGDLYSSAIRIEYGGNGTNITNNIFHNVGNVGILLRQTNNHTIVNNVFNSVNNSIRLNYPYAANYHRDNYEPRCAICLLEIYKTYLGNGNESQNDNLSKITTFKTTNVYIKNNTFNNNTQTFLRTEGAINVTHDLSSSSYWLRSIKFNENISDQQYFYNNIAVNELNVVPHTSLTNSTVLLYSYWMNHNILYSKNRNNINYSMSKTIMNFTNPNDNSVILTFRDGVLTYPYNDVVNNGTLSNIDYNNINVTINSTGQIYVTDVSCDKHYRDSGLGYSCNKTACYFTHTNCTIKTGRQS